MSKQKKSGRNHRKSCLRRSLRHEWLESRSLMAGDILDTPTDPNIDIRSGFADIRGTLEYTGDVDVYRLKVTDQDSFSAGAFKVERGEALQLRVLDASGQEVSKGVVDSSGWISLVGTGKGEYSLAISSPTNEVTEYSVHVSAWKTELPTFPEVTPRADDADEIGPNATVLDTRSDGYEFTDGEIAGASDKDVFTFELLTTGPVQISGSAYRIENAGFKISLFDADGVQIGQGEQGHFSNLIEFSELAAGKYYIMVSDSTGESVGYGFVITSQLRADDGGGEVRTLDGDFPVLGVFPEVDDIRNDESVSDGIWQDDHHQDGGEGGILLDMPMGIEARMHNMESPADVDGDNSLTPLDALILINRLNSQGGGSVSSIFASAAVSGEAMPASDFLDTNNDGYVSPLDVLFVINQLNRQAGLETGVSSEGEGSEDQADSGDASAVDFSFLTDADDEDKPSWWCVLPTPDELFV
ncbi:MAG: pre-peptidase C-terminal domain-containing protein [Planctomycetes bacterium]|nr:pre-peptidase C-terminal domain-containing protein [Planctomycetota bacterium]